MKQINIPIDRIRIKSKFVRTLPGYKVQDLVRSIRAVGLIHPLIVDSDFTLLCGGRRLTALKILEWKEVPCLVYEDGEMKRELITLEENIVRRDYVDLELEEVLAKRKRIYQALYPETRRGYGGKGKPSEKKKFSLEMSEKMGVSVGKIDTMIRRAELNSKKVKKARLDGQLSDQHANYLCSLSQEDQNKILDAVKGVPGSMMPSIIKDVKRRGADAVAATDHSAQYRKILGLIKKSSSTLDRQLRKSLKENIVYSGKEWDAVSPLLYRVQRNLKAFLENQKQVRNDVDVLPS